LEGDLADAGIEAVDLPVAVEVGVRDAAPAEAGLGLERIVGAVVEAVGGAVAVCVRVEIVAGARLDDGVDESADGDLADAFGGVEVLGDVVLDAAVAGAARGGQGDPVCRSRWSG
jgi:hypothetical protein